MTTTVAIVALPAKRPTRPSVRARHTVIAASAIVAPIPNGGPWTPAMKPCANVHARAAAAKSAVNRVKPNHALASVAITASSTGTSAAEAA